MRTPVVFVAGQGDSDAVAAELLSSPGTLVIAHRFDGHIVCRRMTTKPGGVTTVADTALELAHGCASCTIRNDLLILLRRLHRRADVQRIVVHLDRWLEPEPICWAIRHVRVQVGPGYIDGPAARDVEIMGVATCVDTASWLTQTLGDDELADGRTIAQVAVGQAESADVLVLDTPDPAVLAVLCRLAPTARITVGPDRVEMALAHLEPDSRRGTGNQPHAPLLAGQPPLQADGDIQLIEFNAKRPFHPQRLHLAIDTLLEGVVRAKGRLWVASRPDQVMWLESAGGGLRVSSAGKWLAAMDGSEIAYVDPERRVFADLLWDYQHGDRHTAMTVLLCGAEAADVVNALAGALLTNGEMRDPQSWTGYPDPFGDWHADPCDELTAEDRKSLHDNAEGESR